MTRHEVGKDLTPSESKRRRRASKMKSRKLERDKGKEVEFHFKAGSSAPHTTGHHKLENPREKAKRTRVSSEAPTDKDEHLVEPSSKKAKTSDVEDLTPRMRTASLKGSEATSLTRIKEELDVYRDTCFVASMRIPGVFMIEILDLTTRKG
ncbi:hypothetical protein PFICI_01240 [Pestalotiopsis fici W106-1]|uniref:Uncharacterized protein n=1 Tax=Pestalotiopsis fici (strain W106-1 / CGMCC3.15140) TaxID=1229662 RepID=W3XPG8_PESFW|nr:uncharacterized protein PFICI_01240 [Pestalotiopsis fici W106-1]ETS87412.1 hypothetical protein PFICI_01240 [Pestalotiopsis fici W106-1]